MLEAPFPYFGGKTAIADRVWAALGQPGHYIEPFFGSGAVLLRRPGWTPDMTETVNDSDSFLCNVWRAIKYKPDMTATWADWPVNHDDLRARRRVLVAHETYLHDNLVADDMWCDPKLAGYWVWAASCWIGTGLTGLTRPNARPQLGNKGKGVHKASMGQIPHLTDKGMGVHKASICKRPHLANKGKGVHKTICGPIHDWFAELSHRLRRVRVVCGDWRQVCGGDWQDGAWSTVGMFFDPPYGVEDRTAAIYHHDSTSIARDVEAWVLERGKRTNYRIIVAGYEGEYKGLMANGWRVVEWSAMGGYGQTARGGKKTRGQTNRHRERLFFSPHCAGKGLFDP